MKKSVNSKKYNADYFLKDCDGADFWQESFGAKLNPRLLYSWRLGGVKKGEKVLDFGCGRGEILVQAAKTGAQAFGVDYADSALKFSRQALEKNKVKAEVLKIKDEKLPFENSFFDVVFLLDVVEHLYPSQLKKVLNEIKRVLMPQGHLIIHTGPNKEWLEIGYRYFSRYANFLASKLLWEPFFKTKLLYGKDPRNKSEKELHVNEQTRESLRRVLREAGFKNIDLWVNSDFRKVKLGSWFQFTFLQPTWLPGVGKYFALDIWGKIS